jgi:hypothetical protein
MKRTQTDSLALLLLIQPLPPLLDALEQPLYHPLRSSLVLVLNALHLSLEQLPRNRDLVRMKEPNREELVRPLERHAVERKEVRRRVHVGYHGVREGEGRRELPDGDGEVERREDGGWQQLVCCPREDLRQVVEDPAHMHGSVS